MSGIIRIVSDCIRVPGHLWSLLGVFFRRSKPKKIQKSSGKHTLISFDSFQITSDIARSLRCFDVFTSFAFFRRSKPKKIQKSSGKHTLISFDSFQITSDIARSLRCFDVFTSVRWYARRLANTFIRQKHSVMQYRSIACRQRRILHVVCGILTYILSFRCHDEANTAFS